MHLGGVAEAPEGHIHLQKLGKICVGLSWPELAESLQGGMAGLGSEAWK